MGLYQTIYADPPWPEIGAGKIRRGADRHYPLMTVAEIKAMALSVGSIAAQNCHLYLWVTNNFLPAGLEVMAAWGFRYVTKITWVEDRAGLGQYYRGKSEDCLFGIRGQLPYKVLPNGKRAQGVTAFYSPRRAHSEKPPEMRTMIETVSYDPRVELFARRQEEGWDVWGNEVDSDLVLSQ